MSISFLRRVALLWRGCVGALVLLAILISTLTTLLLDTLRPDQPLSAALRPLLEMLRLGSLVILGIYLLWLIAGLAQWLQARARERIPSSDALATSGVLLGIRLPRPVQTADAHGTAAAKGGHVDAVVAGDPLRTLVGSLAALQGDPRVSLELWSEPDGKVQWAVWVTGDTELMLTVKRLLAGAAPGIEILEIPDPLQRQTGSGGIAWQDWHLEAESSYPLVVSSDTSTDPMAPLVGSLTPSTGVRYAAVQLVMAPTSRNGRWQRWARLRAAVLEAEGKRWEQPHQLVTARLIREKADQQGVQVVLRALVIAETPDVATQQLSAMSSLLSSYAHHRGEIQQGWAASQRGTAPLGDPVALALASRPLPYVPPTTIPLPPPLSLFTREPGILIPAEIAAHWHFPSARYVDTAQWRTNRRLAPDPALIVGSLDAPPPGFDETTPLGERVIRIGKARRPDGSPVYLGLPLSSLSTHLQIVAPTGSGKSHTILNLCSEFLRVQSGFMLIDYKGDTVDKLLAMIPRERWGDVVVVDPTDSSYPVGLNLLDRQTLQRGVDPDTLVSLVESTLAQIDPNWGKSVGMQQFIGWGAKALVLGEPNATLAHLSSFFLSETYRSQVLSGVDDIQTRFWWEQTFPTLPEQQQSSLPALQRRLDQFLMNSIVRRICNQPRTSVPFRHLMDHRGIVLVKLPIEVIGEKEGAFIGTLLMNLVVAAAFSRQTMPEAEREPWPVIVDEFQVAVSRTDPRTFKTMIERLRSFGIGLIAAHQYLGQLDDGPEGLLNTVLGTVMSFIILGAQGNDAATWTRQFANSGLRTSDWLGIPIRREGYLKTLINGQPLDLCSFETLPAWPLPKTTILPVEGHWQSVAAPARGRPDEQMDARIDRLSRLRFDDALNLVYRAPEPLWRAYLRRTAEHRAARRQAILEQPGLIPDLRTRLLMLSRLRYARPALEVSAELLRLLAGLPQEAPGASPPRRGGRQHERSREGGPAASRSTTWMDTNQAEIELPDLQFPESPRERRRVSA